MVFVVRPTYAQLWHKAFFNVGTRRRTVAQTRPATPKMPRATSAFPSKGMRRAPDDKSSRSKEGYSLERRPPEARGICQFRPRDANAEPPLTHIGQPRSTAVTRVTTYPTKSVPSQHSRSNVQGHLFKRNALSPCHSPSLAPPCLYKRSGQVLPSWKALWGQVINNINHPALTPGDPWNVR